ncbi:PIG-X [Phascolomyces articulosus]|uniref:Protein PBN1 n=1 Tax=Phascolomyces articulosus TaxID=60185 RepID=A0AAD5P8T5_9FUNG|nr:PIG-X [Phascolomyces articulosus]
MDQVQVSWHFENAGNLHPHIITKLESIPPSQQHPSEEESSSNCSLDIVYQLPASVFVDPNQIPNNIYVFGETDLEAPLEHVKEPRGSTIIIRQKQWHHEDIDLPIHLRYQRPSSFEMYRSIVIPKPRAGWFCLKNSIAKSSLNNVKKNYLGSLLPPLQDTLIPTHRMNPDMVTFQEIPIVTQGAGEGKDYMELHVPVGRTQEADMVQMGTMVAVVACTLWIILATWKSITKRRRYDAKGKRRRSE